MKYTRMLCWLRPHEKKELIKAANGQFPLEFAKNYDDFKNKITDGDYLVLSFTKANKKTLTLVKKYPNNIFAFYEIKGEYIMTSYQFNIADEANVIIGQYSAEELVKNYLGIISNLWEMRLHQTFKSL